MIIVTAPCVCILSFRHQPHNPKVLMKPGDLEEEKIKLPGNLEEVVVQKWRERYFVRKFWLNKEKPLSNSCQLKMEHLLEAASVEVDLTTNFYLLKFCSVFRIIQNMFYITTWHICIQLSRQFWKLSVGSETSAKRTKTFLKVDDEGSHSFQFSVPLSLSCSSLYFHIYFHIYIPISEKKKK